MFNNPVIKFYPDGSCAKYYTFNGVNIGGQFLPDVYVSKSLANIIWDFMSEAEEIGGEDADMTAYQATDGFRENPYIG